MLYSASATILSLKAHRSSIEPPPRPKIITSKSILSASFKLRTKSSLAASPCTSDGKRIISHNLYLLLIVVIISLIAAPVDAVITPTFLGNLGIGFLCASSKYPFSISSFFNFSNSKYKLPIPSSSIFST